MLGKKLVNYVVQLSQEGSQEEASFNYIKANQKYQQAVFVGQEILRDVYLSGETTTEN